MNIQSAFVKDSDTSRFMTDVVEASMQTPVIVDFWAPWCGPCRQLGPALERLVAAENGKLRMVKINVDENQELAGQMSIQSIPAVYAFAGGKPVDGFMGALPESQLKEFIAKLLINAPAEEDDEVLAIITAANQAMTSGDLAMAGDLFAKVLDVDKSNLDAISGLAQIRATLGDIEGAQATLDICPDDLKNDPLILQAKATIDLLKSSVDSSEIDSLRELVSKEPTNYQAKLDFAIALNKVGDRESATDQLLEIVKSSREWNDDAGRKQLVQFFEAWGPTDEFTLAGRRKLSTVLFR